MLEKKYYLTTYRSILFFLLLFLISGCAGLFFQPSQKFIEPSSLTGVNRDDIYFETPDGFTLHGWLLKTTGMSYGTILYLHGNAENISTHVNNVSWLVREGFNVFIFDYRGYGKSEGYPTIEGVHIDAEAALGWLVSLSDKTNGNIFIFGQSLGGAIAVYTVANTQYKKYVKALIIDSAFSSYRAIVRDKAKEFFITWPFRHILAVLVSDYYSPVKWIKKIDPVPVLIMHGKADPIVPAQHSIAIFENASTAKDLWITETKGHIVSLYDKKVREGLVNYLKRLSAPPSP